MKLPHFVFWALQLPVEDRELVVGPYSLRRPVRFSYWTRMESLQFVILSVLYSFALLFLMPVHPMAIPASIGAGVSFTILLYSWLLRPGVRTRSAKGERLKSGHVLVVEVAPDGTARFVHRRVEDGLPERFSSRRPGKNNSTNVRR